MDASIFEKGRPASFVERWIRRPVRQVGKAGLFTLAFAYPISLVYIGLAFGGLAFWAFLGGSTVIIGLVITRLGFASNFRNWDIGVRRMVGVVLGFFVAMGFYGGLVYLKAWFVPVAFGLLGLGLIILFKKIRLD